MPIINMCQGPAKFCRWSSSLVSAMQFEFLPQWRIWRPFRTFLRSFPVDGITKICSQSHKYVGSPNQSPKSKLPLKKQWIYQHMKKLIFADNALYESIEKLLISMSNRLSIDDPIRLRSAIAVSTFHSIQHQHSTSYF